MNAHERVNVIEQCRVAIRHPEAAAMGAVVGGTPPVIAYIFTHWLSEHVTLHMWSVEAGIRAAVAVCALLFSVRTVWLFGNDMFDERFKGAMLVGSLEGAMTVSPVGWLSLLALALLVGVNAIASACVTAREVPVPAAEPVYQTDTSAQMAQALVKARSRRQVAT